jgi:hypothetical protein
LQGYNDTKDNYVIEKKGKRDRKNKDKQSKKRGRKELEEELY